MRSLKFEKSVLRSMYFRDVTEVTREQIAETRNDDVLTAHLKIKLLRI